jgi:hypothetical protein
MKEKPTKPSLAEFFTNECAQLFAHDCWLAKHTQWLNVLKIAEAKQSQLCSAMYEEALMLDEPTRDNIKKAIQPVMLADIKQQLMAYNGLSMMSVSMGEPATAFISLAQISFDNFITFLYLRSSLFEAISKATRTDSCLRRTANYLKSGDHNLSDFRNGLAHGDWRIDPSTTPPSFEIWDEHRKSIRISGDKWDFWRLLARSTAVAVIYAFDKPIGTLPEWLQSETSEE